MAFSFKSQQLTLGVLMITLVWLLSAFVILPLLGWQFGKTVFTNDEEVWEKLHLFGIVAKPSTPLRTMITWSFWMVVAALIMFLLPALNVGIGNKHPTLWAIGTLCAPVIYTISLVRHGIQKRIATPGTTL